MPLGLGNFDYRYRSPNFNTRHRAGDQASLIDTVIIHYTDMVSAEAALQRLCDPVAKVSAHYLIDEAGRVFALVDDEHRAWHAGVSSWQNDNNINDRSIGIELAYTGHSASPNGILPDYPESQIKVLIALLSHLQRQYPILPERVLGHEDVAPGRKIDPGPQFPWPRLEAAGVASQRDRMHSTQPVDQQF
jgi:N-acetylmuramoyl-L-alanine amidase